MIAITSVIPYFLLTFVLLLLSRFVVNHIKFFTQIIYNSSKPKYESLDGLRGFLALSVFFHHSVITYYYFHTGVWDAPPSAFYTLAGQVAISLFFMITGFLFWSKAIAKDGKLDAENLYTSRVLRVYPMYLFSVFLIFLVVIVLSGFKARDSFPHLVREALYWVFSGLFDFADVNNVDTTIINAKVA